MATTLPYLSILRIGPTHDNEAATILKNAVLDHFHNKSSQPLVRHEPMDHGNRPAEANGGTTVAALLDEQEKDHSSPDQQQQQFGECGEIGGEGKEREREGLLWEGRSSGGRFVVSNRYFQAQLLFQPVEEQQQAKPSFLFPDDKNHETAQPDDDQPSSFAVTQQEHNRLFPKEDGIVLAFDATTKRSNLDLPMSLASSFDALASVHDRAVELGQAGDLLRLCVGITMTPRHDDADADADAMALREYEQEYSRRILWCLDRGYEYVEADLSFHGRTKGHDQRDKEGFARIIEAISGTVWSSAIMEKEQTTKLKQSYHETATQHNLLQKDEDNKKNDDQEEDQHHQYVPPDPSLLTKKFPVEGDALINSNGGAATTTKISDEARLEQARQALLRNSEKEQEEEGGIAGADVDDNDDDDAGQAATTPQERDQQRATRKEQREQERKMDQLDSALKQASSIREMSRSGKLSDEERRRRAGDAATVLMNLMNSMGVGSDEDDTDTEEKE